MLIDTKTRKKAFFYVTTAGLAQSVGCFTVLDCRVRGHGLNSQDRTSTHGLKKSTHNCEIKVFPSPC